MSRTKLEFGTSGTIDLMDDVPYSLNFAIADIREPDKRNASYSKTIKIPGSKTNNKLFAHIFEIDINCNFNPNLKTAVRLYVDELLIMQGFLQLLRINRFDENKIEYEVTIRGNVGNIFTEWAEGYLTDLDLSAFNHTYNKTNQKASWSASVGSGYVYPMIDYGMNNSNGLTFDVENYFPAIYVKQYIDSAFALAGYTYESNFFNSTFFKRLIIPYNSSSIKLSTSEVEARLFSAYINAGSSITMPSSNGGSTDPKTTIIQFNAETSDASNQFNTSTYKFTCANTGSYNFYANLNLQLSSGATTDPDGYIIIVRYTPSTGVYSYLGITYVPTITDTSASSVVVNASNISLQSGDVVFVGAQLTSQQDSTPNINVTGDGYFRNTVNNIGVFDGNTLSINNAIPKQVKIKDFFSSIIKMFNLYIETDKTVEKKLYIEPRNDFYANGTTVNWTDKLAIDRDLEIEPMGELNASRYKFAYKEDKDFYNSKYQDSYQEPFGTRNVDIDTDFVRGEKKVEIIFSPTPISKIGTTDRIIPRIISTNTTDTITSISNTNIRILYYGGVKNTSFAWTYTGNSSGTSTETTYPYCGHVDEPLLPTLDLSFGVPRDVYYDTNYYTNNNLFNKYYKKYLDEITDKDSKIITAYFYLTPKDIYQLDFRNQFQVKNHLLRLNKVYDYNPLANELTKCEFIRIKEAAPFEPQSGLSIYGSNVLYLTGEPVPFSLDTNPPKYLTNPPYDPTNTVDDTVKNIVITGTNNYIGQGSSNVSILASSGVTVMPNITNVTVINSNNIVVTESNTTYVNGVQINSIPSEQGITATPGGGQTNAYQTTKRYNLIETVATAGDSVKTISATLDQEQQFKNVGANSMNVYPKEGERFRKGTTLLAIDVPYAVASRNTLHIYCYEAGIWTD